MHLKSKSMSKYVNKSNWWNSEFQDAQRERRRPEQKYKNFQQRRIKKIFMKNATIHKKFIKKIVMLISLLHKLLIKMTQEELTW